MLPAVPKEKEEAVALALSNPDHIDMPALQEALPCVGCAAVRRARLLRSCLC